MVDMETRNQTIPSFDKVKIEVDLTVNSPQRVRIIEEEEDNTKDIKYKCINVKYDYMQKYCKECSFEGHDDHSCWTLHPELYETRREEQTNKADGHKFMQGTQGKHKRTLTSGQTVEYKKINKNEW